MISRHWSKYCLRLQKLWSIFCRCGKRVDITQLNGSVTLQKLVRMKLGAKAKRGVGRCHSWPLWGEHTACIVIQEIIFQLHNLLWAQLDAVSPASCILQGKCCLLKQENTNENRRSMFMAGCKKTLPSLVLYFF